MEPNEISLISVDEHIMLDNELKPDNSTKLQIDDVDAAANATAAPETFVGQETSLSISGYTQEGEVLFKYINKAQAISQTFGLSLKYYKSHIQQEAQDEKH